ncbi:major capsid protein, partial [Pseudomonas aeruginosa]
LLYPAGTFFSAVQNVVNLGAIYDSTGLSKNQRTEMFLEDGFAVGQRGYESRELTIPVAINGQVGLRHATNPAVPAE